MLVNPSCLDEWSLPLRHRAGDLIIGEKNRGRRSGEENATPISFFFFFFFFLSLLPLSNDFRSKPREISLAGQMDPLATTSGASKRFLKRIKLLSGHVEFLWNSIFTGADLTRRLGNYFEVSRSDRSNDRGILPRARKYTYRVRWFVNYDCFQV